MNKTDVKLSTNHVVNNIKRAIVLSMNGVAADKMTKNGLIYRKNYGVSIVRLKEIAANYPQSYDLAESLWKMQIRETMLLALMLMPIEKFSIEKAAEWSKEFIRTEIMEQAMLRLYSKLEFAPQLVFEWIDSNSDELKTSACILTTHIYQQLTKNKTEKIISRCIEISDTGNFTLFRAIAVCLSRLCRIDYEISKLIQSEITPFKSSKKTSEQYIYSEVSHEISFLEE